MQCRCIASAAKIAGEAQVERTGRPRHSVEKRETGFQLHGVGPVKNGFSIGHAQGVERLCAFAKPLAEQRMIEIGSRFIGPADGI